ncbi:polysaccharide deacetylase family protein [Streptomyces sp. LBUM 1476]|uniref:Polysaccharide deacetylase family protein n=1 Tax=Streptomyces acidiscabies TaxID=42234 RepID=A0AAP6EEQ5_9ACTN|nr:polysaccharide deacetylase family protein [Streptomyces acidiscabies]MBP5936220.1 polysaccharide deacetylase family protein [Streptomyces sp. LBUM 1476]MBZ3915835.1 polysaccharide deacetylase family protein [Streptomyces acidiscabies]MDX2960242.1 polysaccharide deacetylase family protein [Streptomyces acidiscabies]MDX3019593.1 polysaccharide deacetylase family protein [Streptomyces acidiscabies]MDX3793306.1 polysaccharide deacetylase family protein [Streptomyces acidiscabies]
MITPVRALATACVLAAALTACGTTKTTPPSSAPERAPSSAPPSPAAAPSLSPPPTLAAAPSGLTPVFEHAPRKARTVALTFDADMTSDQGPRAARGEHFDNPALIATLRSLKIPATVFMTGRWAEEYPDQARSIGRDPLFEVANHSYSHHAFTADCYGLPTVPEADMRGDVEKAYAAFRKAGVPHAMPYFRFPGGCYDKTALRALNATGVTAVQWDVISGDAFATDADAVARQVLDGVKPGSVVVMHCTRSAAPTTERALRTIVPELRRKGYRFVKVSDQIRAAVG